MKNSIPPDVWERKKSLIAKLYKDEEWPLKQVIKKIRSDDFNPSETQLRSRLKKWRVNKSSRQTRKSHNGQQESAWNDSRPTSRGNSSSVSPRTQMRSIQQSHAAHVPTTQSEWYLNNGSYAQQDLPPAMSFDGRSSTTSPAVAVISGSSAYEPPNISPLVDSVLLDSPIIASSFPEPSYTITTDSCMQASVSTSSPTQWSTPQWYSMALEPGTRHPPMPFITTVTLNPPTDPTLQLMPYNSHGVYQPQLPSPSSYSHQRMPHCHKDMKPWQQAASASKYPGCSWWSSKSGSKGEGTSLEGKTSLRSKAFSQPPAGLMTPQPPFFSNGQRPVMCSPMYEYSGPGSCIQDLTSFDF
ncbi:Clr5 domain-containing protein [Aspergillus tanneri]|uniref:Clr5 domain-containing protein n=1 Tax=Aspergillus tanneri TaxID=1220188 RepID=A0A5M9MBN2_9EURO|nr:uncharacterized protein ATNIH1004_011287 [Aspergillus tanneri]KAA8642343.1 hypothetical protein ATNIH1004_011287 [Aspergillus tanneri]